MLTERRRHARVPVLVPRRATGRSATLPAKRLVKTPDRRHGRRHRIACRSYCCPSAPFGPPPNYVGPTMNETGAETSTSRASTSPSSTSASRSSPLRRARIHPFVLGSKDENDVQGYAGIADRRQRADLRLRARHRRCRRVVPEAAALLRLGRLPRRRVHQPVAARRSTSSTSWVERPDATDHRAADETRRRRAADDRGARLDSGAGVDPLSLVIAYAACSSARRSTTRQAATSSSGCRRRCRQITPGTTPSIVLASDYQESKNINTVGNALMPNTTFLPVRSTSSPARPSRGWSRPRTHARSHATRLFVVAGSTTDVQRVVFRDGSHLIGQDRGRSGGVYSKLWRTSGSKHGVHHLTAIVHDSKGRTASAERVIRSARSRRHRRELGDRSRAGPSAASRRLARRRHLTTPLPRRRARGLRCLRPRGRRGGRRPRPRPPAGDRAPRLQRRFLGTVDLPRRRA